MIVTVPKEVKELKPVEMDLYDYWLIRIIKDKGNSKECVAEFKRTVEPTPSEIATAINMVKDKHVFASVLHNYELREIKE